LSTINFTREGVTFSTEQNITILEAARRAGVTIEAPCNGNGTCGKCTVRVGGADVLACRTEVSADIEVQTVDSEKHNSTLRILAGGKSFEYPLKPYVSKAFDGSVTKVLAGGGVIGEESGDTTGALYGLAIDIGTTTLVAAVIDLNSGESLATVSRLNPQAKFAQDVLSRIHFASEPEGLATTQRVLLEALSEMTQEMTRSAGISAENIYEAVYSGNTAMLHLACGVNPEPLGRYPYTPQIAGAEHIPARGLGISPFGIIYLPPIISGFVGPDITSGVLASRLYEQSESVLFIDIGTNGEMVLASHGELAATSTAAGPAFEGMNIACGMRASNGAIESFAINDDGSTDIGVIGGGSDTVGICGSGLVDIAGELVRTGAVGKTGRLTPKDNPHVFVQEDGKRAYRITDNVYFTQNDVRQVQLAKGAIRAGIEALIQRRGLTVSEVDRAEIAGSFGYHLNEKSLIEIGLLPREFAGKVSFVGNTAQSGGVAFLLNCDFREKMKEVVGRILSIELADDKEFEKLFVASLNF
jgi:uncharacterized 2Fe-2S/4Fe-4S cluster protein (DUF4445 family)